MPKKRRACVECYQAVLPAECPDDTCDKCNYELSIPYDRYAAEKAKQWAATHKCRQCHAGLTPDRYFDCIKCIPDPSMDDPHWDSLPDCDVSVEDTRQDFGDLKRARVTEKNCATCKQTLLVAKFGKRNSTRDGWHHHCRSCIKIVAKQKKENARVQSGLQEVQV